MRLGEEEQSEEPDVTSRLAEVRTGRGTAGLVRGETKKCWTDETSKKGKERVTDEKGSMKAKDEDLAARANSRRQGKNEEKCGEEEKREIQGVRRETSPIVRWAWADESTEEEG